MNSKQSFGHYEILQELGRGGMGLVYKAFDTKLDRVVALKVMISELRNDATQIQRFMQEAKAIAQLHHPNIVLIYEIGDTPEAYFSMEYLEGDLFSKLIYSQKVSIKEGVEILIKVCDAVECAHQKNIIHRDLKPSNIMIVKGNQPKVMDFGLAKFLDIQLRISKPGEPIGTTCYMAPEQACGEEMDHRTDIYSIGVILYEILTGRLPFHGTSALSVMQHILKTPPTPPSSMRSDIPKTLEQICLKCLAKKPEDRYQSAETLKRELEKYQASQIETDEVKIPLPARETKIKGMTAVGNLSQIGKQWSSKLVYGLLFVAVFLLTLIATFFLKFYSQNNPLQIAKPPEAEKNVMVEFHSSNTKQDWVDAAIRQFNAEQQKIKSGAIIQAKAYHVGSGSSMEHILQGKIKPTAWSPGSNPWVDQINQIWLDRTGKKIITAPYPATTSEPLVIAMWEPMAKALGWPDKPIGWKNMIALAAEPEGWATVGHPEWGSFKFGHGHPDYANSGLLAIIAETYAIVGIHKGLKVEQVKTQQVIGSMRALEQQVYHYGRLDTDLLSKMTNRGPAYLHAVVTYEANVVKWNLEHAKELRFPFVAIYPCDGTFWVENPYCLLDVEWITPQEREASEIFGKYLTSPEQQAKAVAFALRPADTTIPLRPPIDREHGAWPAATPVQSPHLEYPSQEMVGHILDVFHEAKKKATVAIILDTSGSMQGEKIKAATKGAAAFLEQMSPRDRVIVYAFSDKITELAAGTVAKVREKLSPKILGLYGDGGSALHEVLIKAIDRLTTEQKVDQAIGKHRLYAIVLLTDGKNDVETGPTKNDVLARLPSGEKPGHITIYAITLGDEADKNLLEPLTRRTNGKIFTGSANNIKATYSLIVSEF